MCIFRRRRLGNRIRTTSIGLPLQHAYIRSTSRKMLLGCILATHRHHGENLTNALINQLVDTSVAAVASALRRTPRQIDGDLSSARARCPTLKLDTPARRSCGNKTPGAADSRRPCLGTAGASCTAIYASFDVHLAERACRDGGAVLR